MVIGKSFQPLLCTANPTPQLLEKLSSNSVLPLSTLMKAQLEPWCYDFPVSCPKRISKALPLANVRVDMYLI